ncbi:Transcriptional regulatory protein, C terminal [Actinacidiphila paucisporea]|uniref:Transcriptional regulatory protein, C terminal n=1 Tax=Actinacidiphila paucisporea TaxID=310782 RepID=A0A1M7LYJ9_9ACTN|nr:Transcriptional regulatory protein, C terminal [Actinacidiphila paucisporea]
MRFTVLGPLEAIRDGRPVLLGGANQRAVLAFLLLRPNRVVATSELIKALWGEGAPPTARKMVQNAVAGLRRALGPEAALSTVPPGYVLRIDPDAIDLTRFDELVRSGRDALRAQDWESAAVLLREALALWRGPVLADVAETGVGWHELAMVKETRLAAFEDCVEAELTLGRHREVVGELAAMSEQEPARERTCGLLMLALYRCGRQPEALAAYQRLRDRLVGDFGLDPGAELQDLERAILKQHPMLALPPLRAREAGRTEPVRTSAGSRTDRAAPPAGPVAAGAPSPAAPGPGSPPAPAPASAPALALAERKQVSVLLVRASLGSGAADDPEQVDEALRDLHRITAEEAARYGGLVRDPLGPVLPVLFGLPRTHEDDPARAVRTALAIRDRIGASRGCVTVKSAVATGEILARYRSEDDRQPAEVTGAVLDRCERLLQLTGSGGVRICDRTFASSTDRYAPDGDAGAPTGHNGLAVIAVEAAPEAPRPDVPLIGRDRELDVLTGLLGDVMRRDRPHLATVLGESGIGKSRLVAEFCRRAGTVPGASVRRLSARVPAVGPRRALKPLAAIVRSYAGIAPGDRGTGAEHRLAAAVHDLLGTGREADRVLAGLHECLGLGGTGDRTEKGGTHFTGVFAAWRRLVEEIAARQPLVLVLEDLHHADDTFLDQVEDLTERALRVPLFIVTTARPELRQRRPRWCCGKRDATAVVLDPLSDGATTALLDRLLTRPPGIPVDPQLLSLIGGIPRYAEEYAPALTSLRAGSVPEPPAVVRTIVAARLDTLPVAEKAVLRDAAVFGGTVWTAGVAAVGGRAHRDVDAALRLLERKDFLRRVGRNPRQDDTEYVVRHRLVRDVCYAQLTRQDRLLKHRRAIGWIGALPAQHGDLLVHHYRQLVALSAADEQAVDPVAVEACRALVEAGRRAAAAGGHDSAARCYRAASELCPGAAPGRRQLSPVYRQSPRASATAAVLDGVCG